MMIIHLIYQISCLLKFPQGSTMKPNPRGAVRFDGTGQVSLPGFPTFHPKPSLFISPSDESDRQTICSDSKCIEGLQHVDESVIVCPGCPLIDRIGPAEPDAAHQIQKGASKCFAGVKLNAALSSCEVLRKIYSNR